MPSLSSLVRLARMIRRGDHVVFVTGSGLSAPSGIPTFRGEGGVWARFVLEWGTREARCLVITPWGTRLAVLGVRMRPHSSIRARDATPARARSHGLTGCAPHTRQAFLSDPRAWYNKFWIPAHVVAEGGGTRERRYEPSAGHLALTQLASASWPGRRQQTNVRVITQNIDGEHRAQP